MQGMQFSYLHKVPQLCKQLPTVTARVHLGRVMATALRNETPEQRAARKEQIKAQKAVNELGEKGMSLMITDKSSVASAISSRICSSGEGALCSCLELLQNLNCSSKRFPC
jgi:hypothetical protein